MATDRSDKLYSDWRASTEKFDYFILGVLCAICGFIGQGYRPAKLGLNPAALELIALLALVLAVVAGFRRVEQSLLVTGLNHRQLRAYEARGGMVAKMQEARVLLNEATGQFFTPEEATRRVNDLTNEIQETQLPLESAKIAAERQYILRNTLALTGFLCLVAARVWSAYV